MNRRGRLLDEPMMTPEQANLMSLISDGMFFCQEGSELDRTSLNSLNLHLASMDYITGRIKEPEFYSVVQKYN